MTDPEGPPPRIVRVAVVDEHPVIRGVVRIACDGSDRLELVGEGQDGAAARALVGSTDPDVLVLDLDLPDEDGVETIRAIRGAGFPGRIVVLTGRTSGASVLAAMRAGVDAYLEKAISLRSIGSSILRVSMGERLIDDGLERAAAVELGRFARTARESSEVAGSLTPRELEVLRFIGQGLTMASMAKRLGISPRTVESHIAKLYRKLGVRTRVQVVARAVSLGLIDL